MRQSHTQETVLSRLRRTLSRTLIDVLLLGLLGILIGGFGTEVISVALTGSLPTTPTHVAAGVVALLLGYALALTVAFRALLLGVTHSAEWVVGEVERVVGGVVHEAETVLHIPEESALASRTVNVYDDGGAAHPLARRPLEMIAGIPDEP